MKTQRMNSILGNLIDPQRPYRAFVPQSVKIYPVHQLLPTLPAPSLEQWNPRMARDTRGYLDSLGSSPIGRQLYIHVPFCPAFCHYCCLYKTTEGDEQGSDTIELFTQALIREVGMVARVPAAQLRPVTSIYFGGGTPTVLTPDQVGRILRALREHLPLAQEPEITFEGMPQHLRVREYLQALVELGVNRISYGVQTFQPQLRKELGRIDTVEDIIAAAQTIRETGGIGALNFELLMGVPGQTLEQLKDDLRQSVDCQPDTLDVLFYNAVPGTKYYSMIKRGLREPQAAGTTLLEMRRACVEALTAKGYHHATGEIFDRISGRLDNFNQTHYGGPTGLDEMLALGPSSYGFLDGVVYQNVANLKEYFRHLRADRFPIRTWKSINAREAQRRGLLFGIQLRQINRHTVSDWFTRALIATWRARGLVSANAHGWELTGKGKLWYNMMQLEAMPMSECVAALDLAFAPDEQARLLFKPSRGAGNLPLARELERVIEGPVPVLRGARRTMFHVSKRIPRRRGRLGFGGPEAGEA